MPESSKPTVLVVDDDADLRELFASVLAMLGYPVATAGDGAEALRLVPEVRPAVVLLDMSMPGMDGIGFLEGLPAKVDHAMPIVIAMSAEPAYRSLAIQKGAFDFIEKPIDLELLTSAVAAASAGRTIAPEVRAVHLEHIRERYSEEDRLRDELLGRSRVDTPEFRRMLGWMLRWLSCYFAIPLAILNLLRNQRLEMFQMFETLSGLPPGTPIPPQDVYCVHLIRSNEALVLHDACIHPVYARFPCTTLEGARFYCSVPVRVPAGIAIGTLCIESMMPVSSSVFRASDVPPLFYFAKGLGEQIEESTRDPKVVWTFFPDPVFLRGAAFLVILESRSYPGAPPIVLARWDGRDGELARYAAIAFEALEDKSGLALTCSESRRTVCCLGSAERVATLAKAIESHGRVFERHERAVSASLAETERRDFLRSLADSPGPTRRWHEMPPR